MNISRTQSLEDTLIENIKKRQNNYVETSHLIHDNPEIGNEEYFASQQLIRLLEESGFKVDTHIPEHPTAFKARKSSNKPGPIIGYLAEYDALPELGHACGHNIIGTASIAAAIAIGEVLPHTGGEVVVLGTPAEEGGPNGSAKGTFVKHGLVDELDACMMVHPLGRTSGSAPTLAVDPVDFEFFGKSAHAASNPEDGINALDAVLQLYNGLNALRQHVTDDVRIHGVILDGGSAPNIVPDYARARFYLRAATREKCDRLTNKAENIAKGAAAMTGASYKMTHIQNGVDNFKVTPRFDKVFQEKITALGENYYKDRKGLGSTDAGNISQVVPTIHPYIKIGRESLIAHTDAFREAARSPQGDEALIKGAIALAQTGLELLTHPQLLKEIHLEYQTL
ncbi:amidohydrolase [Halobacillus karajensis]|uniref:Peptidase M20 domain-containing protein 2 n=1 Tax=Halobacillus karajensis TaxID=195088 RepID=A0A059NZ63_9BACI|nr:M20 family metallopeptidase [Halobacillus karajensis]CDQ18601.1 p-aminobenzoyl-glutamate hydrolase subunit B [Halobacillus karajensis]CDQ23327.1 p-aminobenzoyl-glutamate hydrolase subunit B [Halobacillus karajensis]CDQ26809.1 p-aminobenzoyl-glutamate hydrolase subunit B [Halobacillus karajensis]SEH49341.1 amidohydrolase [Halobacillus karajensis]